MFFGGFITLINLFVFTIAAYFLIVGKNNFTYAEQSQYRPVRYFLFGLLVFSVLWLAIQTDVIDNTLIGLKLMQFSALTGLAMGMLILTIILGLNKTIRLNSLGIDLFLTIPIICIALSMAFASQLNQIPAGDPITKEFIINHTSRSSGSRWRVQHFIFIDNSGHEERLTIDETAWNKISAGDSVELEITRGFLGYYTVEQIKEITPKDTPLPAPSS